MLTGSSSMEKNDRDRILRNLGLFSVIISDLIGYTGAGIAIGYFAWSRWGFPWWVLLVTSLAGLTMAFYRLYKFSQRDWK